MVTWIMSAWDEISNEMIPESFKNFGITNSTDGSEDSLIHCLKENQLCFEGREKLSAARIQTVVKNLKEEADFDLAKNLIEIHVHQGSKYHFFNGALHPYDQITSILNLHFDKRKTVRDLREVIYQQLGSKDDGSELTFAKRLPAGLHLYDHLTDDNESISNVGIKQGSDLFLWNGKEVNGVTLKMGIEFEPVLLNIICLNESKEITGGATEFKETQQCFARDTLLHDACEAVIQVELSKEFNIYHQRKGQKFHSNKWTKYSATDFLKTISDLSLEDGDSILVVNPHNGDSCLLKQSGNELTLVLESEWLEVEYFPNRKSSQNEKKTVKVPADERTLLSEIKLKAIEELELEISLVRDDATVNEAGVKLKSTLALCPGCAPTSTQIFLYYIVGADPQTEMEIMVEESTTVKEGFLKLPVWIYPMQSYYSMVDQDYQTDEISYQISKLNISVSDVCEGELQYSGEMEISNEATLEDLKIQAMTLPYLHNISVPSAEFLRAWILEKKRPTKILKGNHNRLKKLNIESGSDICIQLLKKEENLGSKELLLKVQMSVPGEKQYYPAEDLIWDTTKECTALALRQRIASHFSLSLDQIDIAKYFPEKFEWMVISSWPLDPMTLPITQSVQTYNRAGARTHPNKPQDQLGKHRGSGSTLHSTHTTNVQASHDKSLRDPTKSQDGPTGQLKSNTLRKSTKAAKETGDIRIFALHENPQCHNVVTGGWFTTSAISVRLGGSQLIGGSALRTMVPEMSSIQARDQL
ncbi:UBP40 hydrolase, partial [Polypterus senegalus]